MRRPWLVLPALLLMVGPCAKKEEASKPPERPVPVYAAAAEQRAVPVELRNIGSVQPYSTVAIKARVGGQITSVNFREGQEVKKGDLLFTIDRRPLEAALAQVQANVLRDQADLTKEQAELAKSEIDVVRYTALRSSSAVPEETYQEVLLRRKTLSATVEAGKATVDAGKAAVKAAEVLRDYATIYSPIDGRTGDLLIDEGNVIKADDSAPLVVINQLAPIYVQFALAEKYLPEIRRHMRGGELSVRATLPDQGKAIEGKLTFLDNAVDPQTRTITLKGTFENKDGQLWPGQFVNVSLLLTTIPDAIVIPAEAVQTGQQGTFIFVVKSDNSVEMRPIEVRMQIGNESVIASGLKAGELVVTDGHLQLTPGRSVSVKSKKQDAGMKNVE